MNKKRTIISIILLFIFLLITYLVINGYTYKFDDKIYEFIIKGQNDIITSFMKIYTQLGGPYILVPLTLLLIYFYRNTSYKFLIPLNFIGVYLLNFFIKNIIERPRPVGINLITESGFSFPSGHAMVSMAFYSYLAYLLNKKIPQKYHILVYAIIFLLVVFVSITRIYLGVHYASDVVAGIILGLFFVINFITISKK